VSFVVTALFDLFVNGSLNLVMSGERIDYGMHNAQHTSMNSAIVIMLVVYLVATKAQEKRSPLDYLLAALIIGFAVFSLAVSQSRQVWLGLLVLGATFPILYAAVYKLSIKSVAILYILIAGIAIAFLSNENVRQRAMTESDVIERIATLDWDNVPMTSVGIRFNSWIEATKWIERSPVLGTSKESIKHVIKQSDKFQASEHTKYLGHLHNYYIETLVAFGIVGLVFIAVFYGHIYSNVSRKGRKVDFLFLLSFLVFWLFINNFESFNSKYYGLYIQNIVLAGLFVMNVVDPQRVGDKTDVS
jgi:O-antigen ligase